MATFPPYQSALAAHSLVGGVPSDPSNGFGTGMGIPQAGVPWDRPLSGRGTVRNGPIAGRFGDGAPGMQSDVSGDSAYSYIEHSYSVPAAGYDHFSEMREGMLAFGVRRQTGEPGAHLVITLAQLNAAMREQWTNFLVYTTGGGNPYQDAEALEFLGYMREYGEAGLETFDRISKLPSWNPLCQKHDATEAERLRRYHELATSDDFCYCTGYGIRQRVTYLGPIMSLSRGHTLDETGQETVERLGNLDVGVGRRVPCAQQFGHSHNVTSGCKLWLLTTRIPCGNNKFGAFCVFPQSNPMRDGPSLAERTYRDESGARCLGRVRYVGTVNTASSESVSDFAIIEATNTGATCDNAKAVHMHGTLPTFFINAGTG